MGINSRFERADDQTNDGLVITWTSNEPTASSTQTIADGTSLTATEIGQAVKNLNSQLDKVKADLIQVYTVVNAGE